MCAIYMYLICMIVIDTKHDAIMYTPHHQTQYTIHNTLLHKCMQQILGKASVLCFSIYYIIAIIAIYTRIYI